LNDIIFIDHYIGFAVGEQGTILKTADAGETWKQITLDVTSHINAIAATGFDNIWTVGDNSLVLHSIDAGETWEQMDILPENNRQLSDIAFRGNLGYFTGNYATVYKTENYGVNWNTQAITEMSNPFLNTRIHSINIMENKTYIKVGYDLYSTEDKTNWEFVPSDTPGGWSRGNPFFLNDDVGYVAAYEPFTCCGGSLIICKTVNGGKYWEIIEEQDSYLQYIGEAPSIIKMVNETLGYAIFSRVLLKTPAPSHVKIERVRDNTQLLISQTKKGELALKSELNPIKSIEIFDTLGKKLSLKKWQIHEKEANIDINNLRQGVIVIKVIYWNNTISIDKYLIK